MLVSHDVAPVTQLKTKAARLLRSVGRSRRPLVITQSGQPRAVLVDVDTYAELREALLLLKLIAQGEADARAGRTRPQRRVFEELRRDLGLR